MPRGATASKPKVRLERWWIADGDEECPHCGALYAYEAEYRCPDCDGPTCMHCIVLYENRHVCPGCAPAPKPEARRGQ